MYLFCKVCMHKKGYIYVKRIDNQHFFRGQLLSFRRLWLWEDVGNPCCKLWLRWVWSVWAGVPCHPGPGGPHSHHPGHLRLTHNSRENNPRLRGSGDLKISASLCWLCWSTINEQWLFRLCKISLFEFLRRLVQCSMKWRDVSDYDPYLTFSPMPIAYGVIGKIM